MLFEVRVLRAVTQSSPPHGPSGFIEVIDLTHTRTHTLSNCVRNEGKVSISSL